MSADAQGELVPRGDLGNRVLMQRNSRAAKYHAEGGPDHWAPEYRAVQAGMRARYAAIYARLLMAEEEAPK